MEAVVRLVVACCAVAVLGCRGDEQGRRERTAQLAACADAIERAGASPPGEQVEVIARGCPAACPELADWLSAHAAAEVRPGVEAGPAPAGPGALASCGAAGLGPPPDLAHLASEEWLVLAVVARWIERTLRAGLSDAQVPGRLEHVTSAAVIALPAPAAPGTPASRFRMASGARQVVVIGDDLRLASAPHARLRGGRLEVLAFPGAHPGQRVALDQLGAVYTQHAELLAQQGPPAGQPPRPLVIAPAEARVADVLDVITRLGVGHAELAVAGDSASAHPVLLERRDKAVATPEIRVEPMGVLIRGFGDDRVTTWDGLEVELDHFAAVNAPVRSFELIAHQGATIADLVRVLDACVVARVSTVIFAPAAY